jgi:hypothetical protein
MAKLGIQEKHAAIEKKKAETEAVKMGTAHKNQHVKKEKINNALSLLQPVRR